MFTHCVSCGAVLVNLKCEYCGTDHTHSYQLELARAKGKIPPTSKEFTIDLVDPMYLSSDAVCSTDVYNPRFVISTGYMPSWWIR